MKYEIEFPQIKFDQNFAKTLNLPKVLAEENLNTRTRIVADTLAGRTADGGAMRAYSPGYAAYKSATTGSSTVNLLVTGELHRSIVPTATPDGAQLAFQGVHAPSKPRSNANKGRVAKAKQSGSFVSAKRAGGSGARAARIIGGKGAAPAAKSGGGGGSIANAALAGSLYARGFTGWFSYGPKDLERITKRVNDVIDKALKSLIDIK